MFISCLHHGVWVFLVRQPSSRDPDSSILWFLPPVQLWSPLSRLRLGGSTPAQMWRRSFHPLAIVETKCQSHNPTKMQEGWRCGKQYGGSSKSNRVTTWPSNFTPRCIPKRIDSRCSNKFLYTNVHCSIIHNSQKVQTAQMPINRWMDKQLVVEIVTDVESKLMVTRG